MIQAKNHLFTYQALLNSPTDVTFEHGQFMTLYLAPKDYHRIHMPIDGRLIETRYIPGELFSVSPNTTNNIPGLFAKNERLVCLFETSIGKMAVVFCGCDDCWQYEYRLVWGNTTKQRA